MRLDPDAFVRTLSQHIRLRLGEAAPRLRDVAESLGMSPWTLQRRLKRDGVAFADLVKAARRDLALRYVRETDLPLTEVALALGYSELSAFSRAFHVWTGLSPQRYRRLNHA
jgi:AraC-like DNA-binding protein